MKKNTKKLLLALVLFSATLIFSPQKAEASAMPTEEQIQQYQEDGSLSERIQYYEDAGANEYSAGLIEKKMQGDTAAYNLFPGSTLVHSSMPSEGNVRILLLRIDFPDEKFAEDDTLEALKDIAFGPSDETNPHYPYESLNAYYERASYGALHISGDVVNYTAQHERNYYNEHGIDSLFVEAADALDSQIDFSQYDSDHDGYMDGMYIHFAGPDTGWMSTWWSVANGMPIANHIYDGVTIGPHITLHEPSNTKIGAQTLIHETGHALGLPDYYSYTATGSFEAGIRSYDMMFNNIGDFNGFSKWLLGWIKEDEVLHISLDDNDTVSQSVTLNSLSKLADDTTGYKIAVVSPTDKGIFSEYLLIEYDTELGNQSGLRFRGNTLPDGFRVFHVNATLNDTQIGFIYSNTAGTGTKLIESLDPDWNVFHFYDGSTNLESQYSEVPGNIESTYHCRYIAGDAISQDSVPSTRLNLSLDEKKSAISITDFSPQKDSGTVTITQNSTVPSPDDLKITIGELWKDIDQSNMIILPVQLSMTAALNPNAASPVLINEEGEEIEGKLIAPTSSTELYIVIQTDYLESGNYKVKLAAGTFNLGQNVYSTEQSVDLHVGKNMQLKSSGTLTLGFNSLGCASPDGGWYIFSTDDTQTAHLYKINTEGTMSDHTIDFNAWSDQFNFNPAIQIMYKIICLQDGTLALSVTENDATYLLHFNETGELLGPVNTFAGTKLTLNIINNTLKISERDGTNTTTRLWSTDFQSEAKEIPVEYTNNHYVFLNDGYLVISRANDSIYDDSVPTLVDYRNANDVSVATYQIPSDSKNGSFYPGSVMGGFETDSAFYLITTNSVNTTAQRENQYILAELTLKLTIIDKKTGDSLTQPIDSAVFRNAALTESFASIQLSDISEKDGKVFFSITNCYTAYDSPFTDTYCLNIADHTIETRISSSGYTPHALSGNKLLVTSNNAAGSTTYKIYEIGTTENPDTPQDPDTPKDPEKQPESDIKKNPENQKPSQDSKDNHTSTDKNTKTSSTTASHNSNTKKANAAKTGDSVSLGISLALVIFSLGVICIFIKRRKANI